MAEEYLRKMLLVINCCILAVGICGGPLIMRLYFVKGGKRIWFSSWLLNGGWPLTFIPLLISYFYRRCTATNATAAKPILMTSPVFIASAVIGLLTGIDHYMSAYGIALLPVSTSAIVIATQLGFTALFAFFLVKQKFTAYSVNAIVLLTLGSGVMALHSVDYIMINFSGTEKTQEIQTAT